MSRQITIRRAGILIASLLPALLVAAAAAADKVTVYIVPKGQVYHASKDCGTLSRSKSIEAVTLDQAKNMGRRPCQVCNPPK